jgi:RNA polymerase sigma factor (sigma-70 family)
MTHSLNMGNWNSLVVSGLRGLDVAPEQRTKQRNKNSKPTTKYWAKPKTSYRSDPRLVEACLAGDQAAWNELVERYQWLVYSIPRRYGLAKADAEDVMQNVFLIIYRKLETLRDYSLLSAWLIRIAQRESIHFLRNGAPEQEVPEELNDGDAEIHLEQIQRLEAQHAVRQAMEQLDPHCRALLELFLSSANPTYEQVAAQLGCPVGSIGPTRARAFKKLEAILRDMGVDVAD